MQKRDRHSGSVMPQSHWSRMNASVRDMLKSEIHFLSVLAVRTIKVQQSHLMGTLIFRLLFRVDFIRKLYETSLQILISANSYWQYWSLEIFKLKLRGCLWEWRDIKCDSCPGLTGAPLRPKHKTHFFMVITQNFKPKSHVFIRKPKWGLAIHT